MKKLLIILVVGLLVGSAAMARCFPKDFALSRGSYNGRTGLEKAVAVTLFPTYGTTWGFAASSGTSGCPDTTANQIHLHKFVAATIDSLSEQIAQGGGLHLQSLSALLGCPPSDYPALADMVRRDFGRLFPSTETKPAAFLTRLKDGISHDPRLSESCVFA